MESSFSFKKAERLRRKVDFERIFSQGRRFRESHFRFYVLDRTLKSLPCPGKRTGPARIIAGAGEKENRIGFIVGKRAVDKAAVRRNRVRRHLKEAYRLNKSRLKAGRDLVVVAEKGAVGLSFPEVQRELLQLFGKAGLILEDE
ncbi:MAG: ribonuclease P protein component [Nitrospirae bacterium]|nr:ribonuclease P protein component [Nitrospirota bacterium]